MLLKSLQAFRGILEERRYWEKRMLIADGFKTSSVILGMEMSGISSHRCMEIPLVLS